jgi:predicted aminopeptidase
MRARCRAYLGIMSSLFALAAAGFLFLSGCATQLGYLAKQGEYLLRYSSGTVPVNALLQSSATPADTRDFLLRVSEIKSFAVGNVGLRNNENYTRYKDIDRDHLVDVVSACDAVSFAPYLWSYPFLGKLPYKGFYERADAEAEGARLKKEGYDVIIRSVDAFSTLGFTKDPLYSFMKKYSPFQLASLIIHEQTHATLFVNGQPQFNEELATFVGDEGALEWLSARYGKDSEEYRAAVAEDEDTQTFISLLQTLSRELEDLYSGSGTRPEKLARKAEIIEDFKTRFSEDLASRFHSTAYKDLGKIPLNNAYLALYRLYSDDIPVLRAYWALRCGGDLRRFVQAAKYLAGHGDVKALMRQGLTGV